MIIGNHLLLRNVVTVKILFSVDSDTFEPHKFLFHIKLTIQFTLRGEKIRENIL